MTNSLDYSVSPFWNTSSFRWEVANLDTGETLANGVASDRNKAILAAKAAIRQLDAA